MKRFGDYIDTYKLMDAVHDGTTLQILYEGRTADTALKDRHQFDESFEDLFRDRTPEELSAIRKSMVPPATSWRRRNGLPPSPRTW